MKIVLRSPNWLGDAVIATAAARALKQVYPESRLSVLAHPRIIDVWKNNPRADELLPLEGWWKTAARLRAAKFDLGVILPHSFSSVWSMAWGGVRERVGYSTEGRGWWLTRRMPSPAFRDQHEVKEYLGLVEAIKPALLRPQSEASDYSQESEWVVTEEEDVQARAWLAEQGFDEETIVVALCPGATYGPAKRWFPERFIEVGSTVRQRFHARFVVLGNESERALVSSVTQGVGEGAVALIGRPLRMVAAILRLCRAVVSNDTGLMHVAAALRVPTVAIFGSTSPQWTEPLGDGHYVVYKAVSCSPCFQRTCIRREKDYLCLQEIKAEEVTAAVISQLAGSRAI